MGDEKRTFSRIETSVKTYLRHVSPDSGFPTGFDCQGCDFTPNLEELGRSTLPQAVSDFLVELNRKIDILISMSSRKMIQEDYPIQGMVTEISGAGVLLRAGEVLKPEDHVEIVMVLSALPLAVASAVGRVIRRETGSGEDSVWAVEFTRIRDTDQEQIVQFVFKEQRARIREQKWG